MLTARNLHARYGETVAVSGVSLDAPAGAVVGMLGPNGAGKSTTMRMLAGVINPERGEITIGHMKCADNPSACRAVTGYLPENNPLYHEFTVAEHLILSAGLKGLEGEAAAMSIAKAVADCGLASVLSRRTGELSKGFRQRTGLAAALLGDPKVLLLDEPTSGLDPNQAAEVRALIKALSPGKAIILSTHLLAEAQTCCDSLVIIHKGKVAASGTLADLNREAAGSTVTLKLQAYITLETLKDKLRGMGEISAQTTDGETTASIIPPSGKDIRRDVSAIAAREGWPLLEIRQEQQSLEDYFRRLTL